MLFSLRDTADQLKVFTHPIRLVFYMRTIELFRPHSHKSMTLFVAINIGFVSGIKVCVALSSRNIHVQWMCSLVLTQAIRLEKYYFRAN